MAVRRKATRDLKIEQGKRRDAYFARLKRTTAPPRAAEAGARGASGRPAPA